MYYYSVNIYSNSRPVMSFHLPPPLAWGLAMQFALAEEMFVDVTLTFNVLSQFSFGLVHS